MITLFSDKSNSFSQNYLNSLSTYDEMLQYIQSYMDNNFNIHLLKCPHCSAKGNFKLYSSYTRNIQFLVNDKVANFCVTVNRVKCESCNSTHAILPSFIIPYKIASTTLLASIVSNTMTKSVLTVAKKFNISYELIYMYISLVRSFFSNVSIMNNMYNYSKEFNEDYFLTNILDFVSDDFLIQYYNFHQITFLMTKFRNISPRPIYIGSFEMALP